MAFNTTTSVSIQHLAQLLRVFIISNTYKTFYNYLMLLILNALSCQTLFDSIAERRYFSNMVMRFRSLLVTLGEI